MSIQDIIKELTLLQSQFKLKPNYLFHIPPIKNITKRNKIIRKLFGRKETKTIGIIEKHNGKIISNNTFIIEEKHHQEISSLLKNYNIKFNKYEIYTK